VLYRLYRCRSGQYYSLHSRREMKKQNNASWVTFSGLQIANVDNQLENLPLVPMTVAGVT